MQRLAVQFLDQAFHRVLFNAMPMPVFVVDHDVSILEYNAAAAQLLGKDKSKVLQRRGGEILNCVHASETPDGCGRSKNCPDCMLRQAVQAASKGKAVTRQWTDLDLLRKGKLAKTTLRVTAQPVNYKSQSFVLLILEGLND